MQLLQPVRQFQGDEMNVFRANTEHLNKLAGLFDQYRQFYKQPPNLEACRAFMAERISNDESVIFAAQSDEGSLIGFTQLYRSFCSVELKEIFYLYDLFVDPTARRTGTARALMAAARQYALAHDADRLTLETSISNRIAQTLYEDLGYERDKEFYTYHLDLQSS
jgi:ribosomal protein S18 acetylase RimI-like enzyme